MALPDSYSEETLAGYMASPAVLGLLADLLRWTWDGGDYNEILNRVQELANVDDVTQMTGRVQVAELRALARFAAWEAALAALVTEFDFSGDGANMSRDQIFQHAREQLTRAEDAIVSLGYDPDGANTAKILSVSRIADAYSPHEVVRAYLAHLNP